MNDGDKCATWPDGWLEDVSSDIETIGTELGEVSKLVEDWEAGGTVKSQNKSGGSNAMRDAWRNWKWHSTPKRYRGVQKGSAMPETILGYSSVSYKCQSTTLHGWWTVCFRDL